MGRKSGEQNIAGRVALGVSGFVLMAFSTPCVLAMLNDLLFAHTDNVSGALLIGGFCAFGAVGGFLMMIASLIKRRKSFRLTREEERDLLKVANSMQGRLTATELALQSDLSIKESQLALDLLLKRGIAETWPSNDGRLIYVFPEFANRGDRFTAKDPLAISGAHATLPSHEERRDDSQQQEVYTSPATVEETKA